MPGLSLDLKLTSLQKRNYNSIALGLWEFNTSSSTISGFAVQVNKGIAVIQWGDNTQNTTTVSSITARHTY